MPEITIEQAQEMGYENCLYDGSTHITSLDDIQDELQDGGEVYVMENEPVIVPLNPRSIENQLQESWSEDAYEEMGEYYDVEMIEKHLETARPLLDAYCTYMNHLMRSDDYKYYQSSKYTIGVPPLPDED